MESTPFHLQFLPLRILAEGSYGQVVLCVRLKQTDLKILDEFQVAFQVGERVAVKIFVHPDYPNQNDRSE
jgi:hypothetical protein